jgi:hypothetical protein
MFWQPRPRLRRRRRLLPQLRSLLPPRPYPLPLLAQAPARLRHLAQAPARLRHPAQALARLHRQTLRGRGRVCPEPWWPQLQPPLWPAGADVCIDTGLGLAIANMS